MHDVFPLTFRENYSVVSTFVRFSLCSRQKDVSFLEAEASVSFLQMSTSRSLALPPALPKVSAPLWSALLKLDLMGGSFSIAQKNRFACKN